MHGLFDVVVALKGLNGLAEIASGTALLFLHAGTIMGWVNWQTRAELREVPQDYLAAALGGWVRT